jgi:hypothetical protein
MLSAHAYSEIAICNTNLAFKDHTSDYRSLQCALVAGRGLHGETETVRSLGVALLRARNETTLPASGPICLYNLPTEGLDGALYLVTSP